MVTIIRVSVLCHCTCYHSVALSPAHSLCVWLCQWRNLYLYSALQHPHCCIVTSALVNWLFKPFVSYIYPEVVVFCCCLYPVHIKIVTEKWHISLYVLKLKADKECTCRLSIIDTEHITEKPNSVNEWSVYLHPFRNILQEYIWHFMPLFESYITRIVTLV